MFTHQDHVAPRSTLLSVRILLTLVLRIVYLTYTVLADVTVILNAAVSCRDLAEHRP